MKQRVLTAALLIPPVLLAVFLSADWPLAVLALLAILIGIGELARLYGPSRPGSGLDALCMLGAALLVVTPWFVADRVGVTGFSEAATRNSLVGFLLCASLLGAVANASHARGKRSPVLFGFSALWLIAGLSSIVVLKVFTAPDTAWDWRTPVLLCLAPLWVGDTFGLLVGKTWGRKLLAPSISPKKTVEGAAANLAGCLGGAVAVSLFIGQPMSAGVLVGLATGVLGQAGDLLESAMKRSAGLKDSGALLPGHGGLLDRIDSILLSAPAVALIVFALGAK